MIQPRVSDSEPWVTNLRKKRALEGRHLPPRIESATRESTMKNAI